MFKKLIEKKNGIWQPITNKQKCLLPIPFYSDPATSASFKLAAISGNAIELRSRCN